MLSDEDEVEWWEAEGYEDEESFWDDAYPVEDFWDEDDEREEDDGNPDYGSY